jgi:hypothetical protein
MRRAFVPLAAALVVLSAGLTPVHGQEPMPDLHVELSRVVGFIKGQRHSLNRIKEEFPDLALQAQKAESEFNLTFGTGERRILDALREAYGNDFPRYEKKVDEDLDSKLSSQPITRELALNFLRQVETRARSQVPSPFLETLLAYQFMGSSAAEFSRGYTRVFRTKDHPKAKGVDFQIRHPVSWRAAEGDRPNVIQKFVSENGRGLEMVMLMVKDLPLPPGRRITERELDGFFVERELRQMLPAGARFITGKPITLDGHRGGVLVFDQTVQRLDVALTIRSLHFMSIRGGKMITVQCMVSTPPGQDATLQERFSRVEPLFRLVGDSFILQEQYR